MIKLITNTIIIISLIFVTDELLSCLLKSGLDGYYGFHKSAQVVFIGNSRTEAGIDQKVIERRLGVPVAKYAIGGANTADRLILLKHFLSENKDIKFIVYGVDQNTFQTARYKGAEDPYRRLYPYIDNALVGKYVNQCVGSWEEYLSKRFIKLLRFNNQHMSTSVRQLLHIPEKNDTRILKPASEGLVIDDELIRLYRSSITDEGVRLFEETLRFASGSGQRVILLFLPTTETLNRLNADNYSKTTAILKKLSGKYAGNVELVDGFARMGEDHSLFGDYSHLNRQGQIRLSEDIAALLSRRLDPAAHPE